MGRSKAIWAMSNYAKRFLCKRLPPSSCFHICSPWSSIPPSPFCNNSTEQQPSLVDLQLSANYNTSSICSVPLLCLKFVEPIAIRKFARTSKVMMKTSIFLHLMVVMNDAEGGRSILQSNILLKLKSLPPHIQFIYIYSIHRHNTHTTWCQI